MNEEILKHLNSKLRRVNNNIEKLEKEIESRTSVIKTMDIIFIRQLADKINQLAELKSKKEDIMEDLECLEYIQNEK